MQPDRGLPGARRALHADRVAQIGPDQLVLLRLDGGDDVAHRPDTRPLDLRGQDPAAGAELLAAIQVLVLEAGQLALDEAEPPPRRHPLRITDAGAVERAGQRRAPVQHHRLAGVVGDVPPAHVIGDLLDVETPEEQRCVRIVGELLHPAGHVPAQLLRGVGVAGHLAAGREERLGAAAHPFQRGPRLEEVGSFVGEFFLHVKGGHGASSAG